jgi:L-fucose isomerase-like protein
VVVVVCVASLDAAAVAQINEKRAAAADERRQASETISLLVAQKWIWKEEKFLANEFIPCVCVLCLGCERAKERGKSLFSCSVCFLHVSKPIDVALISPDTCNPLFIHSSLFSLSRV